ncbi:hypothetical protein [Deinococcus yunweiensis]|uniref:hypothetical protein n=1 Tax=Deinococcus yunweiensis TaxID=367282 RepID=UPI00398EC7CC
MRDPVWGEKMRKNSILVIASMGVLLSSCTSDLVDNAPVNIPIYVSVTGADLAACDSIQFAGNIVNFLSPTSYQSLNHYDLRTNGYIKTGLDSSEVGVKTSYSGSYLNLKRPGTYVFGIYDLHKYNWKLTAKCDKSGELTESSFVGMFSNTHPVAVITLTTGSGKVAMNLKEFPDGSDPSQLNLP